MKMIDILQLDLKMLRCLDVLVAEAHVTRAAERLDISQPQLSSMLARMRKVFNDPLLVRTPDGMRPTQAAIEIAGHVRDFLAGLQSTLQNRAQFDAVKATRIFNIVAQDVLVHLYISSLIGELRQSAEGIQIALTLPPINTIIEGLKRGDNDLAIAYIPTVPEDFYVTRLFSVDRVCIASADHPRIRGTLSLDEFAQAHHVITTLGPPYLPSVSEQMADDALRPCGIKRRIGVYTQGMLPVPEIVARSDLIAVVPTGLALSAQRELGVQVLPLPFDLPTTDISLIWHSRTHQDAALRWLRTTIKEWAVGLDGARPAPPAAGA